MSDQYIATTLLRAERDAAYEAIRAIWHVNLAIVQDHADGADLDEVIAAATQLLPPELRTSEMPPVVDRKTTEKMQKVRDGNRQKREAGFDDILG